MGFVFKLGTTHRAKWYLQSLILMACIRRQVLPPQRERGDAELSPELLIYLLKVIKETFE